VPETTTSPAALGVLGEVWAAAGRMQVRSVNDATAVKTPFTTRSIGALASTGSPRKCHSAPSAVGPAQAPGDARPQVRLGCGTGDVHSAVEEAVNERTDDSGAIQQFAAITADIDGESIKVDDLTVKQHNRNFRPGFLMNRRPARSSRFRGPYRAYSHWSDPFPRHREIVMAEIIQIVVDSTNTAIEKRAVAPVLGGARRAPPRVRARRRWEGKSETSCPGRVHW